MQHSTKNIQTEITLKKFKLLAEQDKDDLLFILNTPQGRRFFYSLLKKCGYEATSFTGNSTTFFNEGQRNIALLLLQEVSKLGNTGIELKHIAEKEYLFNQQDIEFKVEQEFNNKY